MEPKPDKCPKCGSVNVQQIVYGLLKEDARKNLPADQYSAGCVVQPYKWRCADCVWRWSETDGKYDWRPDPNRKVSLKWRLREWGYKYQNEGRLDRFVRIFFGLELLVLAGFYVSGIGQIAAVVLGIILLITAITGFCPLYRALGMNTLRKK